VRGPVRTIQQAAMLFVRMHEAIPTQVPGFKNAAEVEEAVEVVMRIIAVINNGMEVKIHE